MKLTGQCRKDFDKWISTDFELDENPITINTPYEGDIEVHVSDNFDILPNSMQYGVYVDFFDSVGIKISIRNISDAYWFVINNVNTEGKKDRYEGRYMSRPEARTKAIEKANEIYNKI